MKLEFHNNTFRILMIADTQEGISVSSDTLNLIEALIEKSNPDLIVFSGDQIWGKTTFKGNVNEVIRVLSELVKPVTDRKIPFTICFGNHDSEVGVSKEEQFRIYKKFDGFIGESVLGIDGVGNHCLEIFEHDTPKFLLYLFDSHENVENGYDNVHANQLDWYKNCRDEKESRYGKIIPSIVFQHIPVCEVFRLLLEVSHNSPYSVKGFGKFEGKHFILNKKIVRSNDFMLELPCASYENSGEFETLKEKGEVKGIFFAHDHNNSYQGIVDGILLANTQGVGFNTYGPGLYRGGRVIDLYCDGSLNTFDIRHVDIIGNKVKNPIKYILMKFIPINMHDAEQKTYKILKVIIFIIVLIFILGSFL